MGVASEVGRLRTVMLHRPGPELERLTPRNNDRLLFDGIPWVRRAQEEHDAFAAALTDRGVEVLYLTDLLTEALAQEEARALLARVGLADKADAYLAKYGTNFGAGAGQLDRSSVTSNKFGWTVTYKQAYQGVPVFGGTLKANVDLEGDLTSVSGFAAPGLDLSVTPGRSAADAAARAIAGTL